MAKIDSDRMDMEETLSQRNVRKRRLDDEWTNGENNRDLLKSGDRDRSIKTAFLNFNRRELMDGDPAVLYGDKEHHDTSGDTMSQNASKEYRQRE